MGDGTQCGKQTGKGGRLVTLSLNRYHSPENKVREGYAKVGVTKKKDCIIRAAEYMKVKNIFHLQRRRAVGGE